MPLTLRNTYTRTLEAFVPLDPEGRRVTMYSCGPTVYSYAHIGNFRSFLVADLLRRVLTRRGFDVRQVMNITDVGHMTEDHLADATGEDKLARAARDLGTDPFRVARHFEEAFVADARRLRLAVYKEPDASDPALHPRATEHIPEMLALIQRLLDRGYAYCDGSGQAYFEVARFPEYGRLSGKDLEELEAGARVAVREEKRDARDFALWKVDDKHLMKWDPHSAAGWTQTEWERYRALLPGGVDARLAPGFPGWHIECSAMARAHLGDVIDLHTGGEDNVFPHHECEIAQTFGALGTTVTAPPGAPDAGSPRPTFARTWVHGRHLLVEGHKMSKRDGTFFTVRDLLEPDAAMKERLRSAGFSSGHVSAAVLRYALLAAPYTQPTSFRFDVLAQAQANVERFQSRVDRLRERLATPAEAPCGGAMQHAHLAPAEAPAGTPSPEAVALVLGAVEAFDAALDDNLNTSRALAALFELVGALNARDDALTPADARHALEALLGMDQVLDVLDDTPRAGLVPTAELKSRAATRSLGPLALGPTPDAEEVVEAIVLRQAARMARRFDLADQVRAALGDRGILIEDTPQGVRWKRGS